MFKVAAIIFGAMDNFRNYTKNVKRTTQIKTMRKNATYAFIEAAFIFPSFQRWRSYVTSIAILWIHAWRLHFRQTSSIFLLVSLSVWQFFARVRFLYIQTVNVDRCAHRFRLCAYWKRCVLRRFVTLAVIRLYFSLPALFFFVDVLHVTHTSIETMPFTAHCNEFARVNFCCWIFAVFFIVLLHLPIYSFVTHSIQMCVQFQHLSIQFKRISLHFGFAATLLINLILHVKIYQSQSHKSICISLYTCVITSHHNSSKRLISHFFAHRFTNDSISKQLDAAWFITTLFLTAFGLMLFFMLFGRNLYCMQLRFLIV